MKSRGKPNSEPLLSPHKIWACQQHCAHQQAVTVAFTTVSGWRACRQCTRCGKTTSQIKLANIGMPPDRLPLRAEDADIRRSQGHCEHCEAERAEYEKRRAAKNDLWQSNYAAYLLSPAWRYKRTFIMRRDSGRCRMCHGIATQVHHLTYERVKADINEFNEEMRDLIAVCRPCHEKIHGHSLNGDG
jgi:hypothetical protein